MKEVFDDRDFATKLLVCPLGPHLISYERHLQEKGFANHTVRTKIGKISRFSRWLGGEGIPANELTCEIFQRYLNTQLRNGRKLTEEDAVALRQFAKFVTGERIASIEFMPVEQLTRIEQIEQDYADYLHDERGLAAKSISEYRLHVKRFLMQCFASGEPDFNTLEVNHVVDFVMAQATTLGRKAAKLMTTALRSYLRYARYQGHVKVNLAAAVPSVANWSVVGIPKSLQRAQVERVLLCCNRRTQIGKRDYAILLLLARLGLRAGEVSSLCLDDIDWQSGTVSVHGKGHQLSLLPLPADVGKAIATYLSNGRPRTKTRSVFVRTTAPIGSVSVQSVCGTVRRALIRAGIDSPRKGAHLFRHSLATEMLRKGASLPEIAEVLRHQSVQCTTVYAKVDFESLRTLALRWPGGAQ
jgi:integrase/recombinase XerD